MEILRAPRVTLIARPQFIEPAHLPVQWKGEATDGERLAEFAGRLCYMSQHNPAGRTTREYLENIKKQGHGWVFEHANYSMLLEGDEPLAAPTSWCATGRASPTRSSPSATWTSRDADFVMPPAIVGDAPLETAWTRQIEAAQARLRRGVERADGALWLGGRQGSPPEDGARGGAGRAPERHRDEDRRHGERARLAHDARAALERRRRAGDPADGGRGAAASPVGGAGDFSPTSRCTAGTIGDEAARIGVPQSVRGRTARPCAFSCQRDSAIIYCAFRSLLSLLCTRVEHRRTHVAARHLQAAFS